MNCIIIDDEPLSVKQLESYISKIPFLNLVKSFNTVSSALKVLSEQSIDLMLIDINMPDINGIDFVKSLKNPPMVIFITAHPQFAIESYKVDAIDYILKPFTVQDLLKACNKANELYELRKNVASHLTTEDTTMSLTSSASSDFIFVKSDYKVLRIRIDDIIFIESMSEYVRIYLENSKKTVVTLISMAILEKSLENRGFMRVHRSYIVNLSKVNVVSKMRIVFDNNLYIPIGDMYKEQFINYLNTHSIGKN